MSASDQIIERLDKGEDFKLVAGQFAWNTLSLAERSKLLDEAEHRSGEPQTPGGLSWALYLMTQKAGDLWSLLRALALIIRQPDLPLNRRLGGLDDMRKKLDRVRDSLAERDTSGVRRYKLYEADYYALRGQVAQEENTGDLLSQALHDYQTALAIWEKYSQTERVAWVGQQIQVLQSIVQRGESLLPLKLLVSERSRLQSETEDLRRQEEMARRALLEVRESERTAAATAAKLTEDTRAAEVELGQLQGRLRKSEQTLRDLQEEVGQHEAALHFLTALPRAATAPLWIEVVRLALDQGEIDDLTEQAIERLALACPEEALPLLAEVAARAPEPFQSTPEQFKDVAAGWMAGIAEARTLRKKDARAAAQRLVDSWTAFFDQVSGSDSNA